jgi:hypothetical protein
VGRPCRWCQKAVDGYSSGDFADGPIIVYELREAQQKNGVIFEGERRRVDMMIKDSSLYKSTGGWRFERFWGNDQTQDAVDDSGTSCFECHSNVRLTIQRSRKARSNRSRMSTSRDTGSLLNTSRTY